MHSRRLRLLAAPVLLAALAGCAHDPAPTQVRAGAAADPMATTSSTVAAAPATSVVPSSTTSTTATVEAAPRAGSEPSGASPVAGLSAAQLRSAVTSPVAASLRTVGGPTADRVVLAGGAVVWRVRIPGRFTARSARVSISVGTRVVGEAVVSPRLDSLIAVTTDPAGLVAGRSVSYRWEGATAVAAGRLVVAA